MSTTETAAVAELRGIDLFDDLSEAELERWAAAAHVEHIAADELVVDHGERSDGLVLLLEGTLRVYNRDGDRFDPMGRQLAPTWIGAIAALTGGDVPVRMVAETDARIAKIEPATFEDLVMSERRVHRRIMSQIAPVMGRMNSIESSRERLTSLGTMAAGLAHELNNPASAAKRASAELSEALEVLTSCVAHFVEKGVERENAEQLVHLQQEALAHAAACTMLDVLDAADKEDALADRLELMGVSEPWRVVEPLAHADIDEAWLDRVAEAAGPGATDAAVQWVAASLNARALTADIGESTDRISNLVTAVKSYAYMDRGETVEVDIHEGLETTLVVLGHKLKHTTIEVVREYDRELPKVMVRGAELNQVWTNLLDNAISALGETGTITIRTRRDGTCLEVDIADDGPGIPDAVRERIFEPFFTTKPVGSGTGLGLDVARRIVVDRHDGSIRLESRPGQTTFTVRLPMGVVA